LSQLISKLRVRYDFDRIHVVGYSMGGLVSRAFIQKYYESTGRRTSTFSYPSPLRGTATIWRHWLSIMHPSSFIPGKTWLRVVPSSQVCFMPIRNTSGPVDRCGHSSPTTSCSRTNGTR
jgi:pimeloyl-ACP methyl ester carboxylesterase